MPATIDSFDAVHNLVQATGDRMLDASLADTSAVVTNRYIESGIVDGGGYGLSLNIITEVNKPRLTTTGQTPYPTDIPQPPAKGTIDWVMHEIFYQIDGHEYQRVTGEDAAVAVERGTLGAGSALTLVNYYGPVLQAHMTEWKNGFEPLLIDGGTVVDAPDPSDGAPRYSTEFLGLRQITADSGTVYGFTIGDERLGVKRYKGLDGEPQLQMKAIRKTDYSGNFSLSADLNNIMSVANKGTSQAPMTGNASMMWEMYQSQEDRGKTIKALSADGTLQRLLTENGQANMDITGTNQPIPFKEHNLLIYPSNYVNTGEMFLRCVPDFKLGVQGGNLNNPMRFLIPDSTQNTFKFVIRKFVQHKVGPLCNSGYFSGWTGIEA